MKVFRLMVIFYVCPLICKPNLKLKIYIINYMKKSFHKYKLSYI